MNPRSGAGADGPTPSFGPNAPDVLRFLDQLRVLDWDRALRIWDARAALDPRDYGWAVQRAAAIGRTRHSDAWQSAREAAVAGVHRALGDSSITGAIAPILADVAGAIAIRDILGARDLELVLLPWMWSDGPAFEQTPPAPVPVAAAVAPPIAAASASTQATGAPATGVGGLGLAGQAPLLAVIGTVAVMAAGIAFAVLNWPASDLTAVAESPAASTPRTGDTRTSSPPSSKPGVESSAAATQEPAPSAEPSIVAEPTARPPTSPTLPPAPQPTPKATPGPTQPPPAPTRTPTPQCEVINLVDTQTVHAQTAWNDAGFTGTVTFSPDVPPEYKINWQSLAVGRSVACTSGITVRNQAP